MFLFLVAFLVYFFFFQAEDGIRDLTVTGVQTSALPILVKWQRDQPSRAFALLAPWLGLAVLLGALAWWQAPQNGWKAGLGVAAAAWVGIGTARFRSEERRVGKECRSRWSPYH